MKKIINKEDIDTVKSSLYYKIFDILRKNDKTFYLDKDYNLIWDENKDVVGVINKTEYMFFSDIDLIIENVKKDMSYLVKIL